MLAPKDFTQRSESQATSLSNIYRKAGLFFFAVTTKEISYPYNFTFLVVILFFTLLKVILYHTTFYSKYDPDYFYYS